MSSNLVDRGHVPGRLVAGQLRADPGAPVDRGGRRGRGGRCRAGAGAGAGVGAGRFGRRGRLGHRERCRVGAGVGDVDGDGRARSTRLAAGVGGHLEAVAAVGEGRGVELAVAAVGVGRRGLGPPDAAVDREVDPRRGRAGDGGLPDDRAGQSLPVAGGGGDDAELRLGRSGLALRRKRRFSTSAFLALVPRAAAALSRLGASSATAASRKVEQESGRRRRACPPFDCLPPSFSRGIRTGRLSLLRRASGTAPAARAAHSSQEVSSGALRLRRQRQLLQRPRGRPRRGPRRAEPPRAMPSSAISARPPASATSRRQPAAAASSATSGWVSNSLIRTTRETRPSSSAIAVGWSGGVLVNSTALADAQLLRLAAQLLLVGTGADDQQPRLRFPPQHLREGGDDAVVALVALEPADRGDQRRAVAGAAAVGRRRRRRGRCRWGSARTAPARSPSSPPYSLDLEAGDGDQLRRPPQQRPQQPALQAGGRGCGPRRSGRRRGR